MKAGGGWRPARATLRAGNRRVGVGGEASPGHPPPPSRLAGSQDPGHSFQETVRAPEGRRHRSGGERLQVRPPKTAPSPSPGEPKTPQCSTWQGVPGGLSRRVGRAAWKERPGPLEVSTPHMMGAHSRQQLGVRKGAGSRQCLTSYTPQCGRQDDDPCPQAWGSGRRGRGPPFPECSHRRGRGCGAGGDPQQEGTTQW